MRGALTLLVLSALVAGCAAPSRPVPPLPPPSEAPAYYAPQIESQYRIQIGDALTIRSYYDAQLNQDVVVRGDGRISVLLLGDMMVVGVTPDELGARIREPYRRLVGTTDVTVTVARSAGMNVYLNGEIKTPSLLAMDGNLTLLQAVARAGGTLATADTASVLLIRSREDGNLTVSKVDLEKILHNESPDIYLQRHDVIYVPKSDIALAGQWVDQYINAIVPHFVQFQFGWYSSRVTTRAPTVQVTQ